jgi:acyl-CoA thioesterase-2
MSASFQAEESGLEHQIPPPSVPPAESFATEGELRLQIIDRIPEGFRQHFLRQRPIELRPVEPTDLLDPGKHSPRQAIWVRTTGALPDDFALHQCVLAYASDMTLIDTALRPHGISWVSGRLQIASIDHAMWFHHRFRADEWLLCVLDSPSASGARGFSRGLVYTRDGQLVASVAQEGLIRVRPGDESS